MKKSSAENTYCNPLPIPNIPRGKDNWYKYEHGMFSHENKPSSDKSEDYRSISDPTVMFFDNKWYLYPSYGMAFYSEDFLTWKSYKTEPYCPKYSPTIIPWKNKFLLTAWFCPLYIGDTPLGPFSCLGDFIGLDGKKFTPCDPGLFIDDDGRIFMYAYDDYKSDNYVGFNTRIIGYELDKDNPVQVVRGPVVIFEMNPFHKPWERYGRYHQDLYFGWVEGPHMFKKNGRYYLIYASPATADCSYANSVYYSDTSPLDNFICQKRNPLTTSYDSLIRGAGHGSVCEGPNDTLWCFYTIAMPVLHIYERRIGMDQIFIDENGELYCEKTTKTPQYSPFYEHDNKVELLNLTAAMFPIASSYGNNHYPIYMVDESNLSFWEPSKEDAQPEVEVDLGAEFIISSMRLWFRDLHLDYAKGIIPKPVPYEVYAYSKGVWVKIIDKRNNDVELNINYEIFDDIKATKVKLVLFTNKIGVTDFSIFGRMEEK